MWLPSRRAKHHQMTASGGFSSGSQAARLAVSPAGNV